LLAKGPGATGYFHHSALTASHTALPTIPIKIINKIALWAMAEDVVEMNSIFGNTHRM
jgi:hypothetical protein